MSSSASHRIALEALTEKLETIATEIATLEKQKAQLQESVSVLRSGSSSSTGRNDYAGLGLSEAACKFITDTPGRHRPVLILKAVQALGFHSDSESARSQIGTALKRLAKRGKIQQHQGAYGREYSAKGKPADGKSAGSDNLVEAHSAG